MDVKVQAAALVCAAVAVLVYLDTLDCELCYDDNEGIIKNEDLRPNSSWTELIWNDFWGTPMHLEGSHKSYRPLCVATFRLNYLIHELEPMGYHLVNVLLHSAVCYLYVLLCGVIFGDVWPALIAGLLFAVHPIHTEAVAGVVGRADVLAGLFFVGSFLCYRKATDSKKVYIALMWLLFSLAMSLCSALSKETGITVVAVCLSYDFFTVNKISTVIIQYNTTALESYGIAYKMDFNSTLKLFVSSRRYQQWRMIRGFLARLALVAAFTVIFMALRIKLMNGMPTFTINDNPATTYPTPYRQLQWLHLVFVNSWLLLSPFHLSCDWRWGAVPLINSVLDPWNLVTLVTFAGVAALGIYSIRGSERKDKVVLFALSTLIFPYLPGSNLLFPVGFVVAERVLYIPSMGICILAAYGAWHILRNTAAEGSTLRSVVKFSMGLLLVTYSLKTVSRNRDWQTDMTLYSSAIKIFPQNALMMNNVAVVYNGTGDAETAEVLLRTALQIAPNISLPYITLGLLLKSEGRPEEAEKILWKVTRQMAKDLKSNQNADVYYELSRLVTRNETRLEKGLELINAAVSLRSGFSPYLHNKGFLLLKLQRYEEAKLAFEEVLVSDPDHIGANYKLGDALVSLGYREPAVKYFRKVMSLDNEEIMAKFQLAAILKDTSDVDRLKEAELLFNDVIDYEPSNVNARQGLGVVYYSLGDLQRAEEMFLTILELNSTHQSALFNLGSMYLQAKRQTEAVEKFEKLIEAHPQHISGRRQLGTCYVQLGKLQKGAEMYQSALKLNPNDLLALQNLGAVKIGLGEWKESEIFLKRALELDPSDNFTQKQLLKVKQKTMTETDGSKE